MLAYDEPDSTLYPAIPAAQVYQKGEMKTVKLTDHKLTLELESGGGCFVLPL